MSQREDIKLYGPREKLLKYNAESLTTQELIAILLNSGTQNHSVLYLAKQVEALIHNNLTTSIHISDLLKIKGIGKAKACIMLSVIELTQRLSSKSTISFTSPHMVGAFLYELQESKKETVVCLYLSARQTLLHKEILAIGSLNQTIISPRDVFLPIRSLPLAYMILAHNHPSGDPTPSEEDKAFTQRIQEAGNIIGVTLLDHVILSKNQAYSMKEHGYL